MNRALLFLLILFSCVRLSAQDGIYRSFSAAVQEEQVVLTWAVIMGAECTDMEIQRSTDGINFERIHLYPGICGSNAEDKEYVFSDSFPVPLTTNYYRLKSGPGDRSSIAEVPHQFLPEAKAYSIYPHPITTRATFVFNNPARKPHTFTLRNIQGREIYHLSDTRERQLELDLTLYPAGLYFFQLATSDGLPLVGRIVVQ